MSTGDAPALPLPAPPPRGKRSLLGTLFSRGEYWIGSFAPEAYEDWIIEQRLLWRRSYIVNDPAAIKHVLLDNAGNYSKTVIARRLLEPGLGKGLITMEGEAWRRQRRLMAPSFDHQSIAAYAPAMVAEAERLVATWDKLPPGTELDIAREMMRTTLLIVSRTMFSTDSSAIVGEVARAAARYQAKLRPGIIDMLGFPEWVPRLRQSMIARWALGDVRGTMDRMIAARLASPERGPNDLLGRLIAVHDDETGETLSPRAIRNQIVTIFMAGHETTAQALNWTWYLLSQHPAVEAKLHAELDQVLGGRAPAHDDVARLPYLRMVLDESMRLYPPAHTMSRQALGPDQICGAAIAKGSILFIVPWLLHRHRRLWDEPERFLPERFAASAAEGRPRYAYLPFGAGPRVCIGAAFALTEAMLVLATVAQRYRIRLVPGHPVAPHGLITLRPRFGLKMTLERR